MSLKVTTAPVTSPSWSMGELMYSTGISSMNPCQYRVSFILGLQPLAIFGLHHTPPESWGLAFHG